MGACTGCLVVLFGLASPVAPGPTAESEPTVTESGSAGSAPSVPDPHATTPHPPAPSVPSEPERGGGIEFAVPPPSEPSTEGPASIRDPLDSGQWPDPGRAPDDGVGAITSGAILLPITALATWGLLDGRPIRNQNGNIPILVTGTGLGLIGAGIMGLGIYRQHELRRWEAAYRVRALPQGNGMMAAGAMALNMGAVAALSGAIALTKPDTPASLGWGMLIGGLVAAGGIAPPMLLFGIRRRARHVRTDGWFRPALPPIPTQPAVSLVRGGFTIGVRGQF